MDDDELFAVFDSKVRTAGEAQSIRWGFAAGPAEDLQRALIHRFPH